MKFYAPKEDKGVSLALIGSRIRLTLMRTGWATNDTKNLPLFTAHTHWDSALPVAPYLCVCQLILERGHFVHLKPETVIWDSEPGVHPISIYHLEKTCDQGQTAENVTGDLWVPGSGKWHYSSSVRFPSTSGKASHC